MILKNEIDKIERLIQDKDKLDPSVSQKGIYWHVDHSLKVIIGICKILKKSDPEEYKWKFNLSRLFVFTAGFFPRGKGKAPKQSTTEGPISQDDLLEQLNTAETQLDSIVNLPAKSHFVHPYFGSLNLRMSKKFLKIHTIHHLKIIGDIMASS